jgi:hypothetical protein
MLRLRSQDKAVRAQTVEIRYHSKRSWTRRWSWHISYRTFRAANDPGSDRLKYARGGGMNGVAFPLCYAFSKDGLLKKLQSKALELGIISEECVRQCV